MTNPPDAEEPSTVRGSEQADDPAFGSQWWEQHYQGQETGRGAPSPHMVAELTGWPVGTALDAGCGTGADAVWLARQGWEVTAVDISPTAVGQAARFAADQAPDVAARITWVVADLTAWEPPKQYDLVVSQYVHPGVAFHEFVARLAHAVAPDGTLFVAGHDHADSFSAAHSPENASIGPEAVISSLSPDLWDVEVAETRSRQVRHGATDASMHDLVVRAQRRASC
jgi:2-polyprenyl-3-methyl-5-hydroxy-6-metoxy-1,4-benzoquinol methylase